MKINEYQKIQEYRELGLSQKKVAEKLGLTLYEVRRVWTVTEEEFCNLPQRKECDLDKYREYVLSVLKLSPQIKEANLYYKLQELFPEFDTTKITFYRFMKKLRQETGYDIYKDKARLRTMREKQATGTFIIFPPNRSRVKPRYLRINTHSSFSADVRKRLCMIKTVFVISKNLGNIIFVKEFEQYVRHV